MADSGVRQAIEGRRHRLEPSANGARIVRLADGVDIGELRFEVQDDILDIQSICVDESARGYGAGTEAIRLLLQSLDQVERVTAYAPPDRGLPVYFWARMGFRPLFGATGEGGIRFERTVT